MTKIVVTSKKPVRTQFGVLPKDIPIDLPHGLATFLMDRGEAVLYETKVAMDRPTLASGETEPLLPSPAAPVSQSTTLSLSEPGEKPKRRGRPPKQS